MKKIIQVTNKCTRMMYEYKNKKVLKLHNIRLLNFDII